MPAQRHALCTLTTALALLTPLASTRAQELEDLKRENQLLRGDMERLRQAKDRIIEGKDRELSRLQDERLRAERRIDLEKRFMLDERRRLHREGLLEQARAASQRAELERGLQRLGAQFRDLRARLAAFARLALARPFALEVKDAPVRDLLARLARETGIRFVLSAEDEEAAPERLSFAAQAPSLRAALDRLAAALGLSWSEAPEATIAFARPAAPAAPPPGGGR